MRIFVTGGTGFIGGQLVSRLREGGHELVCLVRPSSQVAALERAGVQLVRGDLGDRASIRAGMQGCEGVAHLAACFEMWVPDRRVYRAVNVEGTRAVMESALELGARKVVYLSTGVLYGNATWPIRESTPYGARCASEYARSKREADELAWGLHRDRGLPLVAVYPGAVLGPGDPKAAGRYVRALVLGKMPAQVVTSHSFAFVHVRDVCEIAARALERESTVGERYLANAENLTFGQFNALVAEVAGIRLPHFRIPDFLTLGMARTLTALADITGRPPLWDMGFDQMAMMVQGFAIDGSKAERELGIVYTPVRDAIAAEVERLVG